MAVAKRQGRKKPAKINQEGRRTGARLQVDGTPGRVHLAQGRPAGGDKRKRRRQRAPLPRPREPVRARSSPARNATGRSSLRIFGSTCPPAWKMDFPAIF